MKMENKCLYILYDGRANFYNPNELSESAVVCTAENLDVVYEDSKDCLCNDGVWFRYSVNGNVLSDEKRLGTVKSFLKKGKENDNGRSGQGLFKTF
jgi:hypothetical protein